MHTTKTNHVAFIHNGDYSGEIFITGKDREGKPGEVVLEIGDIRDFFSEIIQHEIRDMLGNADFGGLLRMAAALKVKFPQLD